MSAPDDLIAQARAVPFEQDSGLILGLADALEQAERERITLEDKLAESRRMYAIRRELQETAEADLAAARQDAERLREALEAIRDGAGLGGHMAAGEVRELARAALADSAAAPPETT